MVGVFNPAQRELLKMHPYSSVDNYARIVLDIMPKKLKKVDKERLLAYEIRERFGFNKMTAFMKQYRATIARKADPLREYAKSKKAAVIKRKAAAAKGVATRKNKKSA